MSGFGNNLKMELINKTDIERALADLSMCQFFPSEPATQAAIGVLLARICPHREALRWVVQTFVDRVGAWKGPVELRAVLATRYRPADGVEAFSAIPGFTPDDSEAAMIEAHEQIKAGGWIEGDTETARLIGHHMKRLSGKVM